MGDVLYAGPFDPEFHGPGQQYQNSTVVIPASGAGSYQLGVLRFYLIGVSFNDVYFGQAIPLMRRRQLLSQAGPEAVLDQYTVPVNVE